MVLPIETLPVGDLRAIGGILAIVAGVLLIALGLRGLVVMHWVIEEEEARE